MKLLKWSENSLDINIIESVWAIFARNVYARKRIFFIYRTDRVYFEGMEQFGLEKLKNKIVDSMSERPTECLVKKCYSTDF